ncbi:MAG: RNA polymerase sigma factor [Reichenbachiella sp.]|uniref:RNA polymerase sigma factor n=1 Tax=Reichenbachiella sp. TaxID=2184521 RepID=UPI002967213B|nr:RNA polymerase sigma factor [Reichenbachiella sp.]MDW3208812.1 RNA polymerase sigma factor [Reichenbachiella sp.]
MSIEYSNAEVKNIQYDIHNKLILQCKAGDRVAQNELYKRYAGAMYNICRRMMNDEDEARDLLQDAFVEAFMKIHSLKELSTFSAWIKRITVNKCINAIKKKRIFAISIDENVDPADEDEWIDQEIIGHEAQAIMKALEQISDGCRTVFNLYLFEGYDHKEISQIMGISESASKSQYSKAKQKIRDLLKTKKFQGYGNK